MIASGIEPSRKRSEQMIMLSQYVKRNEARWTYQRLKEIVFEPMKKFKPENQPDAHTYNLMIKAALVMKRPSKAVELWDEIDANKVPITTEKMISREEIQEISQLKEAFETDKKKKYVLCCYGNFL
jgi:pentatricopeptide repeat protein